MDKYLTSKADPKGAAARLESAAGILGFLLLIAVVIVAVYGFIEDGFMLIPHLVLAVLTALLIMLLGWISDRKRARVHARVITSALCMSEKGSIPFEELMKITGIRRLEQTIEQLSSKGYIRNVAVVGSDVCLTDRAAETAEN